MGTGALTREQRERIQEMARQYGRTRSVALPAVRIAHEPTGRITPEAMEEVAELVGITPAEVYELVTFYSMYRNKPTGRYIIGVCKTLPCALCGGEGVIEYLRETLGIGPGETSADGLFSLEAYECLGACAWAPVMLVNERLHVRLTRAKVDEILEQCRADAER